MNRQTYLILTSLLFIACGGGGGESVSNTPPAAPESILSTGGNTQVSLSWGEASGATTYNIYWSTAAGVRKQTGTKISDVTSMFYHSGLTNGTTYFYVVTAVNQYGESSESREVSATPSTVNPPLPPSNVATLLGDRNVIIRWTSREAGEATSSHHIYWSNAAGVTKENGFKISGATSPYTHTDLTNGLTYYYVITGINENGEGRASAEVSATPEQGNVPSAPTGVTATVGSRQAIISWTPVSEAAFYNLYWSTSPDISSKNGTKIANVTSPYTYTGLIRESTYYYVVTSVNGYGESADSAKASVTIPNDLMDICVALGDSITIGLTVANYTDTYVPILSALWGKKVENEGKDGVRSSYGAAVIDDILVQYNPRYVTIYYGTNDSGFYSNDWIIGNLRYIIKAAKAHGAIPVVATIGPFFGDWAWKKPTVIELNQRIRQMAAEEGVSCADLEAALNWNSAYIGADGLHPNSAGHQIIANTFYGALRR